MCMHCAGDICTTAWQSKFSFETFEFKLQQVALPLLFALAILMTQTVIEHAPLSYMQHSDKLLCI